tara:strand:- start:1876 stop:2148 length:273 start_codon:yes stop_codon:yes gene_type:complete
MKLTKAPASFKIDKPLYKPYKSTKAGKVGMVYTKNGLIHFGASDYRQNYSAAAKKSYCARSAGIKDKNGKLTKDNKESANYYSRKYLWGC